MIMTQKTAPTGSARSIALIACVSLLGWLATPALSLDQQPKPADKKPAAASTCDKVATTTDAAPCVQTKEAKCVEAKVDSDSACIPSVMVADDAVAVASGVARTAVSDTAPAARHARPFVVPAVPAIASTSAIPAGFASDEDDQEELSARLERLEQQMERLAEQLERLNNMRPAVLPPMPPTPSTPLKTSETAGRGRYVLAVPGGITMTSSPDIVRKYALPEGKLDAVLKLMVRDDVPIRVQAVEGGIEVHGPEHVQATFKAFVDIITTNRETKKIDYTLSKGKLDALQALMIREDVPVVVTPGEDKITVLGDAATQAVFRNFVSLLNGPTEAKGVTLLSDGAALGTSSEAALPVPDQVERHRARAERNARRNAAQREREAYRERARAMQKAMSELMRHSERIERQIEKLEKDANKIERQAENMRKKAGELRRKAGEASGEQAEHLKLLADDANDKADAMMDQADLIRDTVNKLEDEATAIEDQIEAMENELEDIEEQQETGDA